ncbi:MAG: imidazole glycerol phosphate synthase cyclase subunit [Candidatus Omnitrophica bacterium]|nr:imidazole glycerol phosphate synthase cyclase subunit [Candidatus Omnitrophota bacterium]MDD5671010.1 imidazole glycerol phosphate synthase cyclase subunit [Candidatus Omnitrophota bacterium]
MLKVRIIPTLLWKNVTLVKGIGFDSWRRIGTIVPAIKVYDTREVDELILVDITATLEGRPPDYESIYDISGECFVPLTVGGGVCHLDHIRNLLRAGADKVAINSAAYGDPELIRESARMFGSQCIVASIDAKRKTDGTFECYSHAGTQPTGKELGAWARQVEASGAGEILITSIEKDGTMSGYDVDMVRTVTGNVRIPVIASGGAGNYEHMLHVLTAAHCSAVAAASIFHFTQQTPLEAKQFLAGHGIPVRNFNVRPSGARNGFARV